MGHTPIWSSQIIIAIDILGTTFSHELKYRLYRCLSERLMQLL